MKPILILAALALAGCSSGFIGGVEIRTSPQAEGMRTCAALTDILTPGVSPMAIASMVQGVLTPTPGAALGEDPAEAMRECAEIYDALTTIE